MHRKQHDDKYQNIQPTRDDLEESKVDLTRAGVVIVPLNGGAAKMIVHEPVANVTRKISFNKKREE